ncbi:hypothetical protein GOBAR_AA03728 [Gossypium barbadense]|uniref:Uncharacterized protein n=1 Tax=Gossypium barbadense TaxID=3634 RepID=A0A2P5YMS4_GOSBA|nr:hypothetical protein GOBAR_AA03728 [Gossypium barbadense]
MLGAADIVFRCEANVLAIGTNVTHQVVLIGMYLNDPTAILVAINPSLITYVELYPSNSVMMYDCSLLSGMHMSKFVEIAEWSDQPSVKVAVTVDAPVVLNLVMERLME